jgi:predicted metal-dependent hydrolase
VTTKRHYIDVRGTSIEVVRKDIKNLHVGVYPPRGRVRVAAPLRLDDDAVRMAVVLRLGWIRRQRNRFEQQERQSKREMVTGESHYFLGRRCRLRLLEKDGPAAVVLRGVGRVDLCIPRGSRPEERETILQRWQRAQLRALLAPLVEKWQPRVGVKVAACGIKKMKTKWGSCNRDTGRVWVNLELIKKPPPCIEYIVVHELVHLLERHHNDRFTALMDGLMPQWRHLRTLLNTGPLGHESWSY